MLIKIKILSPFRYEYRGKRNWVATGESLVLETSNKDQREELKYIMSSTFPFKEFIYIDTQSLPSDLRCEINENRGFYKLPTASLEHAPSPVEASDFFRPLGEAEDNKFIHPVINETLTVEQLPKENDDEALVETVVEECDDPHTTISTTGEVETTQEEERKEDDRESRERELAQTPYTEVKAILESYGGTYTNKREAIEAILEIEE